MEGPAPPPASTGVRIDQRASLTRCGEKCADRYLGLFKKHGKLSRFHTENPVTDSCDALSAPSASFGRAMAGHWSLQSFKPQGRGPVPRPESFGRYDPINHSLLIDVPSPVPPGSKHAPIGIKVGNKGRLHAVLDSHDKEVLDRAKQAGVPMSEPLAARHEYHKGHVKRKEDFGRFDPISAQLTFQKSDGSEHTVRVGDNGRLRAVFESGHVDSSEARAIGLPEPERYKGKGVNRSRPLQRMCALSRMHGSTSNPPSRSRTHTRRARGRAITSIHTPREARRRGRSIERHR